MTSQEKFRRLRDRLRPTARWALSLSGGVDSVCLLHELVDAVGRNNVLALTAKGPNFPRREFREAVKCADELKVEHIVLDFAPLEVPEFVENGPERCYYCKKALFSALVAAAGDRGFPTIADGANADDVGDYRPGMRATAELGIHSPLLDAGIGKADIRAALRQRNVSLWNKPSFACLASRFPYGDAIDAEALARVEQAESFFLDVLGFRNIRVRHHGKVARLEAEAADRDRLLDPAIAEQTCDALRELGYAHVAVDLQGYRSGSMNEGL